MRLGKLRLYKLKWAKTLFLFGILLIASVFGNSGEAQSENPFFQPIQDQNLAAIEYLVRQGVDVNQANEFGLTPLEYAIRAKAVASAQLLFRYGASFKLIEPAVILEFQRQPGIGPFLERYAYIKDGEVYDTYLKAPNTQNQTSRTPLNNTTQNTVQNTAQNTIQNTTQNTAQNNTATTVTYSNTNTTRTAVTRQAETTPAPPSTSSRVSSTSVYGDSVINQLRPQNRIGLAAPSAELPTVVESSPPPIPAAQTMIVSPRRQLESPQVEEVRQSANTEEISAFRQDSETPLVSSEATSFQETILKTVANLAAPAPEATPLPKPEVTLEPQVTPAPQVAPAPKPATQPQVQPTYVEPEPVEQPTKLRQVHYGNPAQVCDVSNPNLVVTFTFDDGERSDLAVIEEVFAPRNVAGTLGIVLNRIEAGDQRYMPVRTLQQLQSMGWEIASHSINHDDLTNLDIEDLDYDLLQSHQGLQALGFNVSSLVYPFGANNSLVRNYTSKYYYGAFEGGYRLNTRGSNPFKLKRFHIADAHDFNYYKRVTDAYSNQHGWLVWAVHTNLNFDEQQVEYMHELLDYMCDQGIRVVTAREGLDHLNLVDVD